MFFFANLLVFKAITAGSGTDVQSRLCEQEGEDWQHSGSWQSVKPSEMELP